jgi:hypothetical protein
MEMSPGTRRLFLGDWGRTIRDPIDLLRLVPLLGAVGFALAGDLSGAIRLVLTSAILIGARFLSLPRPFDLMLCLLLALGAFGYSANLFEQLYWFDEITHATIPAIVAPLLYLFLIRTGAAIDLSDRGGRPRHADAGIFVTTTALGLSVGALFEVYEWVLLVWLGEGQGVGYGDTIADLVLDTVSSMIGGALLLVWAEYGWGTVRRVGE